jgi:hypothetical protein
MEVEEEEEEEEEERELTGSGRLGRQRRDGVVDVVRSSMSRDMATSGCRSGRWLPAAALRVGHQQPFLRATRRHSCRPNEKKDKMPMDLQN